VKRGRRKTDERRRTERWRKEGKRERQIRQEKDSEWLKRQRDRPM
jgi:hypothetical protein